MAKDLGKEASEVMATEKQDNILVEPHLCATEGEEEGEKEGEEGCLKFLFGVIGACGFVGLF